MSQFEAGLVYALLGLVIFMIIFSFLLMTAVNKSDENTKLLVIAVDKLEEMEDRSPIAAEERENILTEVKEIKSILINQTIN